MPDLAVQQRAFARALRNGAHPAANPVAHREIDARDSDGDALARLFTTDAETSARRIAIYRGNSIASAGKALTGSYPVIREVVGEEFFDELARAYWMSTPSQSGDLGDYGAPFDEFLEGFEHVRELPYLADLARLEWAVHRAECAADAPPFDASTLADVPEDRQSALSFTLVPGTAIVTANYPIARIWTLHRGESSRSTDMTDREHFDIDWTIGETALVARAGFAVRVIALDAGNAASLRAVQAGAALVDALAAGVAAAELAHSRFDAAAAPASWLTDGLLAGFRFLDVPTENADVDRL